VHWFRRESTSKWFQVGPVAASQPYLGTACCFTKLAKQINAPQISV
jgi:hypothetical protein